MDSFPITSAPSVHKNTHLLLVFLIILALLSLGITTYLLLKHPSMQSLSSNASSKSLISGTFDINGVIPSDAVIVLKRTNASSPTDTAKVPQSFPAMDQGTWSLENDAAGKSYIVTASIVSQGKTIATADPIEVTSPAADETITFNVPETKPSGTAVISGNIHVDGYIPTGATIAIQGRVLGKPTFSTIAANLPATPTQFMSYASAVAGQTYEVIGVLFDSTGNQIGSSSVLEITAPALNETLTINSQAVPPATPTPTPTIAPANVATQQPPTPTPTPLPTPPIISGSIDFNGVAPANSRIVIFEKKYNAQQYQVAANNVTPADGTTWQWTGAQLGTWYNIIAILKQTQPDGTDKDIALSQTQSIAAPASNLVMTINSGIILSAPTGTITANCGSLSNGSWNGQMLYASVPGAQSYWLEIGSAEGSNDIFNSIQNTNNQSNQTANANFNNGIAYYARYAYATNLNAGQPQFSPFSATTQFKCSQ